MIRRCRPWLGTLVEIAADSEAAIEAGFTAVGHVHRLMSAHEPLSELSRINRGERVRPSAETEAVLERALFWFTMSDGAFDPVVAGRRSVASGALPLHPGQAEPGDADFSALDFDGGDFRLNRPACLDLGGIAKGYAVDAAVAAMRAAGSERGLVNAGGDLFVFGSQQRIEIVDPATREPRLSVMLQDRALATSAGIRDGARMTFDHLPGMRFVSVSVEAARAIDADALTKIVWLGHPKLGELLKLADARSVAIAADGAICQPAGLRDAA